MKYDYELTMKPWRELTLMATHIDSEGLHFSKGLIPIDNAMYLSLRQIPIYAIDTGFMGHLVHITTNEVVLDNCMDGSGFYSLFNYSKYTPSEPNCNSEDHY